MLHTGWFCRQHGGRDISASQRPVVRLPPRRRSDVLRGHRGRADPQVFSQLQRAVPRDLPRAHGSCLPHPLLTLLRPSFPLCQVCRCMLSSAVGAFWWSCAHTVSRAASIPSENTPQHVILPSRATDRSHQYAVHHHMSSPPSFYKPPVLNRLNPRD